MNKNFLEYYTLQKGNNELYSHSKTNSIRKKTEGEEIVKLPQKTKKISENNSNKRYNTPLSMRYQVQSYDINQGTSASFSCVGTDLNQNSNINQYLYQEKPQKEKDNDASYYKNLYIQTKNNLNKEKQKNEEIQRNLMNYSNLVKENNMLKEKINNLTNQLDRLINLVEKSNIQNKNNLNIKQDEINKLNSKIESLMKNNSLKE